ncbi:MAG: PaaI family thioesterase [Thermodesulfobacteriota bacterium]|nr:PaaI family thioesterase [Thermodesulfobacteriota bacterium]
MAKGPIEEMDYLEAVRKLLERSPFSSWLGVKVTACRDGCAELVMTIRKDHTQSHGYVHGAVIGGVADIVSACAASSVAGRVVTAEYKLNFLSPAIGERLVARSRVLKTSARQAVCRTDVFAVKDGRENLAATALVTMMPVQDGGFLEQS